MSEHNLHTRALAGAHARWANKQSIEDRFWSKVKKTEGCWIWTAFKNKGGYGVFGVAHSQSGGPSQLMLAPRMAWTLTNGEIPEGQYVLHSCDNPSCVNPDHLRLGSLAENAQEMWSKRRGRPPPPLFGEDNANHRLTDEQVRLIRSSYPILSQAKLATLTGASESQIRNILKGRQRKP